MAYLSNITTIWSTLTKYPSFGLPLQYLHHLVYLSNMAILWSTLSKHISNIWSTLATSLLYSTSVHIVYVSNIFFINNIVSNIFIRRSGWAHLYLVCLPTPNISIIWSTLPMSIIYAALFQHLHQLVYLNQPHLHHMVTFGTSLLYVCSTLATSLSYLSNISHLIYLTIIFRHHVIFEIRTKKGVTNYP